jgi:archaeosine-15-forming tRNA-guanine transglycosylase
MAVRVTQTSAEALVTDNTARRVRATQVSAEALVTVGTNPAVLRVTQISAEVLMQVVPPASQRSRVVWIV